MSPSKSPIQLDLRGLKCPLPRLKTEAKLRQIEPGQTLEVTTTDPLAVIDIPHLAATRGDACVSVSRQDEQTIFLIVKGGVPAR